MITFIVASLHVIVAFGLKIYISILCRVRQSNFINILNDNQLACEIYTVRTLAQAGLKRALKCRPYIVEDVAFICQSPNKI